MPCLGLLTGTPRPPWPPQVSKGPVPPVPVGLQDLGRARRALPAPQQPLGLRSCARSHQCHLLFSFLSQRVAAALPPQPWHCQPPVPANSPQTPKDQLIPSFAFLPLQLLFPLLCPFLHPPHPGKAKILLQSSGCKSCARSRRNPNRTGILSGKGDSAGQILICPLCII